METINHEYYVSLEVAKLLKEAGFDWGCDFFYGLDVRYRGKSIGEDEEYELKAKGKGSKIEYVDGGIVYNFYHSNKEGEDYGGYSRPTLDVAQRWLREVKRINIEILYLFEPCNHYFARACYLDTNTPLYIPNPPKSKIYEEVQEAGIKKALELILEKRKKTKK